MSDVKVSIQKDIGLNENIIVIAKDGGYEPVYAYKDNKDIVVSQRSGTALYYAIEEISRLKEDNERLCLEINELKNEVMASFENLMEKLESAA